MGIVVFPKLRFTFLLARGTVAGRLGIHSLSCKPGKKTPLVEGFWKRSFNFWKEVSELEEFFGNKNIPVGKKNVPFKLMILKSYWVNFSADIKRFI